MHISRPTRLSSSMRRAWFLVVPFALVLGVVSATLLAPSSGSPATTQISPTTSISGSSPDQPPRTHIPLALPELDLPPLDPDPAWWKSPNAPGSIGVPWISREGTDPSNFLENDTQRAIYESVSSCFPSPATPEQLYEAKVSCFDERIIRAAATTPNPADTFAAVRALNTARPDVFTVCHNASHKVGEIALRRIIPKYGMDKNIIAALLDRGANACMGGLMHGTLDAVGLLVSEIGEFAPAVEACLLANPTNLGYCTDAIGHATWDAFEDVDKAAEVCSFFETERGRRECGEGILMRIYQRGETKSPWFLGNIENDENLPRWNQEIVEICEAWPTTPFSKSAPENPQEWCWSGSVYLMFKPLFYALEKGQGKIDAVYDEIASRLVLVIDTCGSFPTPGDDICLERMGLSVGHIAAFDVDYAKKLCTLFPTPVTVERCERDAISRIESAFRGV